MKMTRGKQQILFNYLPGKTFDFDKSNRLAQITSIRGMQKTDLNVDLVLQAVKRYASAWQENLAGIFHRLHPDQVVLLEPQKVYSQTYPKVLWCQEKSCGYVFESNARVDGACPNCKKKRLIQLRWIKVHRCGHIEPLTPPYHCPNCNGISGRFRLDTRGSERINGFRWICRKCKKPTPLFGGYCRGCDWKEMTGETENRLRQMNIEVHRAGRTYYPHYVELLNQPGSEMNAFLETDDWQLVTAAYFLELPQTQGQSLMGFVKQRRQSNQAQFELSEAEESQLRAMGYTDEQIEQYRQMQESLKGNWQTSPQNQSTADIGQTLVEQTGVSGEIWRNAGQEMLEAVLPAETGHSTQELFGLDNPSPNQQTAGQIARHMGIERLTLTTDFPMTLATFGFSRVAYEPDECRLNAFPADGDHQGKFPIFVDVVQADAIIVRLDAERVWGWLKTNDFSPTLPNATNPAVARQAYFVQMFNNIPLRQRLTNDEAEARMVFGLLHTMSHLFVRRASLLCGLDKTSLAEYVLPRALTFAIYCNHSHGETIGALASLFEQSLAEWLSQVQNDTRRCVYDPVCHQQHGGNCHACTHLAETSCRFFNLNLGRCFLFGGLDEELGDIKGYFDSSLNVKVNQG